MKFQDGQTIVFIGDSITDCGRREDRAPYGDGYVSLVRALVSARHPQPRLNWVNRGISGDTVRDLAARWESDAVAPGPDWLSVMIGINDVWRAFGDRPDEAVPIDEYESTLRALLAEAGCPLIIATPYLIEPDRADPQRARSDRYADVARRVAADLGALLVDTQALFDRLLEHRGATAWAPDRVHPGLEGHTALALAFLEVIESR